MEQMLEQVGMRRTLNEAELSEALGKRMTFSGVGPLSRKKPEDDKKELQLFDESRELELSFSSDEEIDHGFFFIKLRHTPEAADLSRLNDNGALLFNHNMDMHIGSVQRASIDPGTGKGRARVKFGSNPLAQEKMQDVKDRILDKVSFAFDIQEWTMLKEREVPAGDGTRTLKIPVVEATKWSALEVSLVTVPRDVTVGVGRSEGPAVLPDGGAGGAASVPDVAKDQVVEQREILARSIKLEQDELKMKEAETRGGQQATATLLKNSKEIRAMADKVNKPEIHKLAMDFIQEGKTADEFSRAVLERMAPGARVVEVEDERPGIGMRENDLKRYSFLRAMQGFVSSLTGGKWDGLEREAHDESVKKFGREPKKNGFFIPYDVMGFRRSLPGSYRRDLQVQVATQGGFLVATDLLASSFIELLRARMVTAALGARVLTGLVGDLAIPKMNGGATTYWLGEGVDTTESQATIGQVAMKPKRLAAYTEFTRWLMKQSSMDVEMLIRDDFALAMAIARDKAAIQGAGSSSEPRGIINLTGVNSVDHGANGGAPTWAKVVEHETAVANDNADLGSLAYLTTPNARGKMKTTEKATNTGLFIWPEMTGQTALAGEGIMNGYRAMASNQVPNNLVDGSGTALSAMIFGNWADLLIGSWEGMEVIVDPFSMAKSGKVGVTVEELVDVAVRHEESFAVSKDIITT